MSKLFKTRNNFSFVNNHNCKAMANDSTNTNKRWRLTRNVFEANRRFKYINQCDSCKNLTEHGRRVILFNKLNLNASTDDFVFYGYLQFIGRTIFLLLLGIVVSFLLQEKSTEHNDGFFNAVFVTILILSAVSTDNH